jgi:hypothetical protein
MCPTIRTKKHTFETIYKLLLYYDSHLYFGDEIWTSAYTYIAFLLFVDHSFIGF